MNRSPRRFVAPICAAAIAGALSYGPTVFGSTGNFSSPLTNAFLSVDINGGPLTSAVTPTNGYNDNTSAGAFSADNFGVVWTPWGGNAYAGGDGTQLPSSQSPTVVSASSISKTFSINGPPVTDNTYFNPPFLGQTTIQPVTATISIDTTNNTSQYAQVGGVASMNSRDRGTPTGANGLNDSDMFRDLLFAGGSGSNVQGTNFIQVLFGGLTPGQSYEIAMYSYDSSGGHTTNWTDVAPTTSGGLDGWWASSPAGNNTFTAPTEQSITWTSGTTPAPAIFDEVANSNGLVTLWAWGGNGVTGNQSSDTTYVNGFQIAAVPEPGSIGLLALSSIGLIARRRRRE